jgi:hypothetical protein
LASNTKKREGKAVTSLRHLFDLFIIVIFIIVVSVAVQNPRVFHNGRRKRRVDSGLGGFQNPWKCSSRTGALLGEKASGSSADVTHG